MGVDVMALMGLLTGGGNLLGQVGNLGTQGLGNANTIMDMIRYWQRNSDPLMGELRQSEVNRYNSAPYGPFGDVGGSFGGLFGTREDGTPVQYGDMAARNLSYQIDNNPGQGAMEILQSAPATRPASAGFADMFSGTGRTNAPTYTPATIGVPAGNFTRGSSTVEGLPAAPTPEPQLSNPRQGGIGATVLNNLDSDTISGLVSGAASAWQNRNSGGGGGGGGGGNQGRPTSGWTPSVGGQNTGPVGWDPSSGRNTVPRSYAVGTPYVPETGQVKVHQGEAVTPAAQNPNAVMTSGGPQPAAGVTPGAPMNSSALKSGADVAAALSGNTATPYKPTTAGGGTQNNAGPAEYDINKGRAGILQTLAQNPASLGDPQQAAILQAYKDERDKAYLDQERQIRELFGAQGTGDSGVQDRFRFDAGLARGQDISGARRDIGIEAARTNQADRINSANTILGHQLGMGQAGLDYDRYQQELVDRDRAYAMQLANQYFGTGANAQQAEQSSLNALGGLVTGGESFRQNLLGRIWQQLMARYANPDVSAAQQYSFAPNPYINTGGGDSGGGTDWFTPAAGLASSAVGAFF